MFFLGAVFLKQEWGDWASRSLTASWHNGWGGVVKHIFDAAWRADDYLNTCDGPMEIRMKESENILGQRTSQWPH